MINNNSSVNNDKNRIPGTVHKGKMKKSIFETIFEELKGQTMITSSERPFQTRNTVSLKDDQH